mgnify:CR=1 FL=1
MKCPNEQFCRIGAAFWGILSIKKSFGLFPCKIDNQQGTGGSYIK